MIFGRYRQVKQTLNKKSYKDLKEDPSIKFPALAWALNKKSVYISVALVGCLAVGGTLYQGVQAVDKIGAPLEENSPYLAINPTNSAGVAWATKLMEKNSIVKKWEMKDSIQPSHGFLQDATGNNAGEVPITLLASRVASSGPNMAVAQIYGAGQAKKQYDHYVSKLSTKGKIESKKVSKSGIYGAKFEQGFILIAGDAIVAAQTANNDLRDQFFERYLDSIETTLPASGCADLSAVDSSKRSLYFDANNFEGLKESKTVKTEVDIDYLPTVSGIGAKEIKNPYAETPEAPLPKAIATVPKEVAKPTIDTEPKLIDGFANDAVYRIQDPVGPGCGWNWSAQNPLEYNSTDLENAKNEVITKVQNKVNDEAQSYVDNKISWARTVALVAPKVDNWNVYVKEVNDLHKAWRKLEADRAALLPSWNAYLAAYENWSTFDARKAAAKKSYDATVEQCLSTRKTHDEWEEEWGTEAMSKKMQEWQVREDARIERNKPEPVEETEAPSDEEDGTESATLTPTPTPTPTEPAEPKPSAPTEPKDCAFDPVKPVILGQEKPAKPVAPTIPEDVTIPNSWSNPEG